ncbi:MAG TPA: threonine synthase, partial [Geminicoccaceae bacterium]|nr:threonine synthase [Geminicoccaceae bacterium]
GCLDEDELAGLVERAYAGFDHAARAPLVQVGPNRWLLELFHGPTLAFKDYALQLLGLLFEHFLAKRKRRITIVGATSGDTGSAAIDACAGREWMAIVVLHPRGRVSEVQRRQMTTVAADNVHNVAIEGTFDDCQALVKAMFNDPAFRLELNLAAINSINWGRIMAQAVYYVCAALALGGPARGVAFAVPTGNFGDVYAGYVARQMGLPIERLIVATNRNDILARFLESGVYERGEVAPTISPSMDIQVASNFERLLFELCDRDGGRVRLLLDGFAATGRLEVAPEQSARARAIFQGSRVDETATRAAMAATLHETGLLVDPHTAVGLGAAAACRGDPAVPLVTLATAHPAKFPDAVREATGVTPGVPPRLAELFMGEERFEVLPNDLSAVQDHVRRRIQGTP